jgi:DNA-directed RNA polymerase specialized sigma24 family protein
LFLIYVEELRYEQAAKIMHKNTKQITNLVYRGKQILQKLLPPDYPLFSKRNTPL